MLLRLTDTLRAYPDLKIAKKTMDSFVPDGIANT